MPSICRQPIFGALRDQASDVILTLVGTFIGCIIIISVILSKNLSNFAF